MTTIRVLDDSDAPTSTRVFPGTVVTDAYVTEAGDAWYLNPRTGDDWLSLDGDFEVVEEEN